MSDTPFQALTRRMLQQWTNDPAVTDLIKRLDQQLVVDDASRAATYAANQMATIAASKRDQPDWVDRCVLMGAMRSVAVALWRLDDELSRAARNGMPDVEHLVAEISSFYGGYAKRCAESVPHVAQFDGEAKSASRRSVDRSILYRRWR